MNTKHNFNRQNLKNFFFISRHKQENTADTTNTLSEEDKNLADYIDSYQQVTRWK